MNYVPRFVGVLLAFCLVLSLAEPAHAACGDGQLERGEACDDGNSVAGDGCSACTVEWGYTCDPNLIQNGEFDSGYAGFQTDYPKEEVPLSSSAPGTCQPPMTVPRYFRSLIVWRPYHFCPAPSGNRAITFDIGATPVGSATSAPLLWGQRVSVAPNTAYAFSFRYGLRQCDASLRVVIKKAGTSTELVRRTVNSSSIACTGGNSDEYFTFSTDASTSAVDVRIEVIGSKTLTLDGISMRQSRSTCSIIHGNGSIYGSKQCDDGNIVSGDGCSATSQLEPGYKCTTPEVFVNGKMDQTLPSFTSNFVVDTTPVAGACGTRPTSSPREGTFLHSAAPQITCGCDEVFGMCLAFRRPATFIVGSPGYSLFRTPLNLRSNTIHTASLRYAAHSANGGGRARVNFTVVGGASSSTVTGESVAASPVKFQTVTSKFISAVASSGGGGGNYLEVFLPNTSYATDVVLDSISVRGGPSECRLVTGTAPGSAM